MALLVLIALILTAPALFSFVEAASTRSSTEGIACGTALQNGFLTCRYTSVSGQSITFYLHVPTPYDPTQKYPLVLLLHGGGERAQFWSTAGQNASRLLNDPYVSVWGTGYTGPDNPRVQARWPSFVVVPQLSFPNRWVNIPPGHGSYTMAAKPTTSLLLAKETVDALRQKYAGIDANRLYVTGLSIGGYGTWEMIERWPSYFAAAAPIAGAGDPAKASVLKNLPIWAFQGSADPIVPVSGSRNMIAAIEAAGGHPRYTEYPGAGHEVWIYPYSITGKGSPNLAFYTWLFSQHKRVG